MRRNKKKTADVFLFPEQYGKISAMIDGGNHAMDQMLESFEEEQGTFVAIPWLERFDRRGEGFSEGKSVGIDYLTLLQENEFR